jgi:hypothetical protein
MTSPTGGFRIAEGYVEVTTRVTREEVRNAGREAAADFERAATPEFRSSGERSGRTFSETLSTKAEGVFRDSRGRFTRAGEDVFGGVGDGAGRSFGSRFAQVTGDVFSQVGSKLGQSLQKAVPGAGQIASGLLAAVRPALILGSALTYLPPVISAIAGGLASIPALLTGAVGAIGVLGLGFHGVGAAIGEALGGSKGGGGGGAGIDQTASAERRLAQAQREAADAQKNLNDARVQAAKDIAALAIQLNRAQLDEQGAQLGVLEAQRQLLLARANTSDPYAVARAQLAYREAVQTLVEAKAHTQDLSAAQQDAAVRGVEGSDRVQQALEQQANAISNLQDAEESLARARQGAGGGGGAASALAGLAPSAKAFVAEIKKLKPEFHELQQEVQQDLFAGWDKSLDKLARTWMPHLKTDLGGLATSFNGLGKGVADAFSRPAVLQGFDAVIKGFSGFIDKLGPHLPGFADAFGKLSSAAVPFLTALGDDFIKGIDKFSGFIDKADKNGSLQKFFKDSAQNAHDLLIDIKDIGKIVFDALGILLDNKRTSKDKPPLQQLHDDLKSIDDWLNSDKGRADLQDIAALFRGIGEAGLWVAGKVIWLIDKFHDFKTKIKDIRKDVSDAKSDISGAFASMAQTVASWMDWLGSRVTGVLHGIREAAKDAFNWVSKLGGLSALGALASHFRDGGVTYAAAGLTTFGTTGAFYSKPVYGIAEPGTGGELFMPRYGQPQRQQMLAGVAAMFAGGSFVPGDRQSAGSRQATISTAPLQPVNIHLGGEHLATLVLGVIDGNPTVVSAAGAAGNRISNYTNTGRRR